MKIKSLELKGFKSFGDKTEVHFNQNVTGVVGPNGCGKSNIVDAIRWVLGEQKTSALRSDKMSSVIFNGTKKRKASNFAEVSLTFENSKNVLPTEFNEIRVTRKYYRSGDSEYMLNNVVCRLKDITSLFLDTGIGSDSYAIIELGMVDDILSDRERSRRRLIEQAAGISKFKIRKKETLSKLKLTQADLDRVEDLLFEIEGNLKTLEKQAKKAREFQEIKEKYKNLSVQYALLELKDYNESYEALQKEEGEHKDEMAELDAAIHQMTAQLEELRTKVLNLEKELGTKQKGLNEFLENIRSKENQKSIAEQKIVFLEDKQGQLQSQISNANQMAELIREEMQSLQLQLVEKETNFDASKLELNAIQSNLEEKRQKFTLAKDHLDQHQSQNQNLEKQLYEIEKNIAINLSKETTLNNELGKVENDEKQRMASNASWNEEAAQLQSNRDQLEKKLSQLLTLQTETQSKIKLQEESINAKREELSDTTRKLDAKLNELNLTQSLIDNLEGYPESIKFLNQNEKTKAPLLSDIISCKEEYRVVIENYLEPYLNYYVVSSFGQAALAVNLLSDAAKGRANFFVLDQFKSVKASTKSAIGIAAQSIIDVDKRYQHLADYLLRDVYILTDKQELSENNLRALNESHQNVTFLSANGKYATSGKTLVGGSVGLFEGVRIGRAKNLAKLKKTVSKLEKQTSALENELAELRSQHQDLLQQDVQSEIKIQQQAFSAVDYQLIGIRSKMEQMDSYFVQSRERKVQIKNELSVLQEEKSKLQKQFKLSNAEVSVFNDGLTGSNDVYNVLNQELSDYTLLYNQTNIEFHKKENELNNIKREIEFKNTQLEQNVSQEEINQQALKDASIEINSSKKIATENTTALQALYKEKELRQSQLNLFEGSYFEDKERINELEKKQGGKLAEKRELGAKADVLRDKVMQLKIELNSLRDRLLIEFHIRLDDILDQELEKDWEQEALENKVNRYRRRIENFGEINPMAVEAFDEMKERYDFITKQKKDLVSSKESLLETIKEIEETAKEKFMESFVKIRKHFINVFRTLFTEEDDCDIVLTDPENPLESDIEITAKPKGKRPQTITQLSGGEKTLTATALLFALYLLKPAPFCVLDEVDAPLDDTNIQKFSNIIRKFSDNSQFIIVTHNKQTMSTVDVIYGVTMPETGVSRVVPVDFSSLN